MADAVLLILCLAVVVYIIFGLVAPKAVLMRRERRRNARRGITMRPGWTYRGVYPGEPDCMSPTGRERDCVCGGSNPSHRHRTQEEGDRDE